MSGSITDWCLSSSQGSRCECVTGMRCWWKWRYVKRNILCTRTTNVYHCAIHGHGWPSTFIVTIFMGKHFTKEALTWTTEIFVWEMFAQGMLRTRTFHWKYFLNVMVPTNIVIILPLQSLYFYSNRQAHPHKYTHFHTPHSSSSSINLVHKDVGQDQHGFSQIPASHHVSI